MEKGQWLKECEVCNAGLVTEMERLMGNGISQRAAAKELVQQQEERLGTVIYPESAIRQRYMYHTNKVGRKDKVVEFQPPPEHDEILVDPSWEDDISESGSSGDGSLTELASQDSEQSQQPTEDVVPDTEMVQIEPKDHDRPENSNLCTFGISVDPEHEQFFADLNEQLAHALEMVRKWSHDREEAYRERREQLKKQGLDAVQIKNEIGLPISWKRPYISAEQAEAVIKNCEKINKEIRLPFKRILDGDT